MLVTAPDRKSSEVARAEAGDLADMLNTWGGGERRHATSVRTIKEHNTQVEVRVMCVFGMCVYVRVRV